jgi:ATP synthase protein I
MQSEPIHRGDLSQDSPLSPVHRTPVTSGDKIERSGSAGPRSDAKRRGGSIDKIDPASRRTRGMYNSLSASSVGLELGISVLLGLLFGLWLDHQLGTEPWLMLLWLCIGFAAGFRGVLRAVRREDKLAEREAAEMTTAGEEKTARG